MHNDLITQPQDEGRQDKSLSSANVISIGTLPNKILPMKSLRGGNLRAECIRRIQPWARLLATVNMAEC